MSDRKETAIGRDFTLAELFRFTAPAVFTRFFVSLLSTLDDSLFVSRFLGQNALAAFSVAMPWISLMDAIGMVCSSVSAVCSIKMGEKKDREAKSDFTTMVLTAFCFGVFLSFILFLFMKPILRFLGETDLLMPYAVSFFKIFRFYVPLMMTGYVFRGFYVIAGKPKYSMYESILNIGCQFFFDWLFIVKLHCGIAGAAYANLIGNLAVTAFALLFFSKKDRDICFVKPESEVFPLIGKVFRYGRMEALTFIALSVSSYVSNRMQLAIGREEVVAASTIVSNVTFLFMNSFFGLIGSTSPIAAYAYGEKNPKKLSRVMKQTILLITGLICFIIVTIVSLREFVVFLYLTDTSSEAVKQMVRTGFLIYPLSLIFFGYNVYVQEILNVLGEHKASMFLSFLENVVFQNVSTIVLLLSFGVKAIWHVFPAAEFATFLFTLYFVYKYKDVYGYGRSGIASFVNK